jgi:hypothetical protein
MLRFGLPREAMVSLRIYGVDGGLVRELAASRFPAGEDSVRWDLENERGMRGSTSCG